MATLTVPAVLGGEVVLGKPADQGGALAELVREGLPAEVLFLLAKRLNLTQAEISAKIGIPQRTLTRRLTRNACLTPAESDRTVRLAHVFATAAEALGTEEKAAYWLKTPNRALRGG